MTRPVHTERTYADTTPTTTRRADLNDRPGTTTDHLDRDLNNDGRRDI